MDNLSSNNRQILKNAPFTMENSLKIKENHRQFMKSLSIDEKIKRVESLRQRLKSIRKLKKSAKGVSLKKDGK